MKTKTMKIVLGGQDGKLSGPADVIDEIKTGKMTATVAFTRGLVTFKSKAQVEPDPGEDSSS